MSNRKLQEFGCFINWKEWLWVFKKIFASVDDSKTLRARALAVPHKSFPSNFVCQLLNPVSLKSNITALENVVNRSSMAKIPLSVISTFTLLKHYLVIKENKGLFRANPERKETYNKTLCLDLLKIISHLADSSQKGKKAQSVSQQLKNIGLSEYDLLTEFRHRATHKSTPNFFLSKKALKYMIFYFYENYWSPTFEALTKETKRAQNCNRGNHVPPRSEREAENLLKRKASPTTDYTRSFFELSMMELFREQLNKGLQEILYYKTAKLEDFMQNFEILSEKKIEKFEQKISYVFAELLGHVLSVNLRGYDKEDSLITLKKQKSAVESMIGTILQQVLWYFDKNEAVLQKILDICFLKYKLLHLKELRVYSDGINNILGLLNPYLGKNTNIFEDKEEGISGVDKIFSEIELDLKMKEIEECISDPPTSGETEEAKRAFKLKIWSPGMVGSLFENGA